MSIIKTELEVMIHTCCTCGTVFGIQAPLLHALRENQGHFFCPRGHEQHFPKEPGDLKRKEMEVEKWKQEFDKLDKIYNEAIRDREELVYLNKKYMKKIKSLEGKMKLKPCPICGKKFQYPAKHIVRAHEDWTYDIKAGRWIQIKVGHNDTPTNTAGTTA